MSEVQEKVENIKKMQRTVDNLLKAGELHLCNGCLKIGEGAGVVKSIYSNGITVNITNFKVKGAVYPAHCHPDSQQILICTRGAFVITFENMQARSVHPGEVCVLKPKEMHTLQTIEDDTETVDVCVPREKAYQLGVTAK
jgi:quercetin dioxygenase-like cupin family protein